VSLVRSLALHARYQCARTGVCCGSGWQIPVESRFYRGLRDALHDGRLRPGGGQGLRDLLPAHPGLPEGFDAVFGQDEEGRCLFYEQDADGRGRCAVHHQLGPDALPMSCRHFPRMVVLSPLGMDVSLSHYCPTAAGLLFSVPDTAIVEAPPAFPPAPWYEGLDARGSGPLLRPGVHLEWETFRAFESFAVRTMADPGRTVPEALDALAAAAEGARGWSPAAGPLADFVRAKIAEPSPSAPSPPTDQAVWDGVLSAVPPGLALRADAQLARQADPARALPASEIADLPPVRRYLAARSFASWLAVQGQGLRTAALAPRLAWVALRVQAGRRGGVRGEDDLREAIRAADLVLMHLAAPERLAQRFSAVEAARG
jgi:Fe-S-cluster containining protein